MQYHTETKYTIWYNDMQGNTMQYYKIAYNTFQTKTEHFQPQKGPFLAIGARKRPTEQPNGYLPENWRYPELPQDLGKLWSHWVGSVWGEISVLFGRSIEKKLDFWAKNVLFWTKIHIFWNGIPIFCHKLDWSTKNQPFCASPAAIWTQGRPLGPKNGSKRAILGNRCQETTRRAAERAYTGKPKVSRVTSGHGEVIIP